MKRTSFLLILTTCLCILASSCRQASATDSVFAEAEKLMYTHPDSALKLLQAIPNPEQLVGKAQADYALLLTEARSQNLFYATSDSLIRIAVDYYKDSGNKEKAVKSLIYLGDVWLEMKDYRKAVLPLKQAEEEIEHAKSPYLHSQLYQNLGHLNQMIGDFTLAYSYYMKSFQVLCTSQVIHPWVWNWNDKFLTSLLSLPLQEITEHIQIRMDSLQGTIVSCSLKPDPNNKQFHIGIQLSFKESETLPSQIFWNLANTPNVLKESDEMIDSLYLASVHNADLGTQVLAYKTLYKRKLKANLYKEATYYIEKYEQAIDAFHKEQEDSQIKKIQQKYDKEVLARKQAETQNLLYKSILGFILFTFIISIVAFKYHINIKRKKRKYAQELQEQISQITSLSDEKEQMETEILKLKYMLSQSKTINQECIAIKEWGTLADIQALGLYLRLTQSAESYYPMSELPNLMHWLDLSSSYFATRLKEKFPHITHTGMNLCCLIRMGYSIDQIATIMHIKTTSIHRNIYRTCTHLGLANNKETFIDFITSF